MYKIFLSIFILFFSQNILASQLIWFSPRDSSFLDTRAEDKRWENARKRISVYKFYYQQIVQENPDKLCRKLSFLKNNNIQLAVEWPAMTWIEHGVGYNVEGFSPKGFSKKISEKVHKCNTKIDYVAMDEPLFFGHVSNKGNVPKYSVSKVASEVAINLKEVWEIFPEAKVGDIEPIDQLGENYASLLKEWIVEFKKETGHDLNFIHNDVIWADNWQQSTSDLIEIGSLMNVRIGVIFNAENGQGPDSVWMTSSRKNIDRYFDSKISLPDDIIFQSWNRYPNNISNDLDKNSHSSIIEYFSSKR
ncbi:MULTISPECIES: hypothetical protein [Pectobacterium]|uniref:hypothetical protein n=1 Tax=Pectobacterium TaxID=122277 RepID=UPI0018872902|nr:hypothetical protein [Pectobacterium carotovorum]MBG0751206.1 hypothetical protein [Pectobacterium carotovorum subsp. carotovorum PCCS1]